MNENMNNTNEFALDMSDLVVEYRTEDGIVQAVNGLDLQIEHGSTLGRRDFRYSSSSRRRPA